MRYVPNFNRMSERINYFNFHNKNVIYMFHTTIKSNRNVPVIKIGFTNNLFERIKSLEKHYDAKFKLINVKLCDRISDEKLFHKMILLKYGDEFTFTGKFKKTRSTELYYYDERLLNEFDDFDPLNNSRNFYINININNEMKVDDTDMDCSDHSSDSDYEPSSMDESSDSDSEMDTSDSEQDNGDEEVLGDTDSETEEEVSADEGPSESDSDDCDEPPKKKFCSIADRWRMDTD